MSKIGKIIRYIIANGTFATLGIYGLIYNVQWSRNVFWFMCGVIITTAFLIGLACKDPKIKKVMETYMDYLPYWIDVTFDLGITFLLAATGHYIVATLYLIHVYCLSMAKGEAIKPKAT